MKAKKLIVPGVYLTAILLVIGSIYLTISGINKYFDEREDFNYAIDGLEDNAIKEVQANPIKEVVKPIEEGTNDKEKIVIYKPYTSDKVSVGRNYYDYKAESKDQEQSIIFYENTYMQNTGIDYVSEEEFDVINVLPGKVISIANDENLGNIIKIEHDKNIISVYEGVDNIKVKEGDIIEDIVPIATSGVSNINSSFNQSLHFEVYYNGEIINPQKFYEMDLNNLE